MEYSRCSQPCVVRFGMLSLRTQFQFLLSHTGNNNSMTIRSSSVKYEK